MGYSIYMALSLIFLGPIFIAPFLAEENFQLFNVIHDAYAPACHQFTTRSLCYFSNGSIGDCAQPGANVSPRQRVVVDGSVLGYKFPVCARDIALYSAMILGGVLFPLMRKIDDKVVPSFIYFVIALVPIALDGVTQLIGLRESTNTLRIITGFIAGIVIPFYLIPILNVFVLGKDKRGTRK